MVRSTVHTPGRAAARDRGQGKVRHELHRAHGVRVRARQEQRARGHALDKQRRPAGRGVGCDIRPERHMLRKISSCLNRLKDGRESACYQKIHQFPGLPDAGCGGRRSTGALRSCILGNLKKRAQHTPDARRQESVPRPHGRGISQCPTREPTRPARQLTPIQSNWVTQVERNGMTRTGAAKHLCIDEVLGRQVVWPIPDGWPARTVDKTGKVEELNTIRTGRLQDRNVC